MTHRSRVTGGLLYCMEKMLHQSTEASQSSDLDHSPMELESDSVGHEKYHQSDVKEEDLKLCQNFSVKLHSHRACTIPYKKIESIKACNKDPDSGGIAYLSHSCSKCSNNPSLVKTEKNNLGHTTYHVHETVEKFKVCTPCTKYKTSKVCTMLNKSKAQKEDVNNLECTEEQFNAVVERAVERVVGGIIGEMEQRLDSKIAKFN